ncbi:MAG: TetR family transcriptional regulator [Eubacterium sp.]|nr:TetR family transcriptional regulator [Eubacterium sp.]
MKEPDKNTRRRGDVLIDSIYDATVKIIKEVGYANLTFRQIAQNAKTSRTVLYRRWTTTFDLIREIMVYKSALVLDGELFDKIRDTGSLRSDLLLLLTLYQSIYNEVGTEIMNAFLFEMSQSNEKIDEIKIKAIGKNILTMEKLLRFAKARGDKLKEVGDMTLVLPFDLIRMENIVRKDVVDTKRLEIIVDEILLPVFKL